jgi:hypothetical protein
VLLDIKSIPNFRANYNSQVLGYGYFLIYLKGEYYMSLDNNYFKLPNDIFDLNLKASEFQVLVLLMRYQNNNRNSFPSYNHIALKCNMSKQTAITTIKSLEDKNIIEKQIRPSKYNDNDSNMYVVKIFDYPSQNIVPYKEQVNNSELTIETNEDLKSWLNRYCRFTYGKDFIDNGKDIDTTYSLITKIDLCTLLRKSINNYESFTIDKLNEMVCNYE